MIPKVLVISNECFSKHTSNGRTLGNFFVGWPKDKLAQFYLTGVPDYDYCNQFFHVSDQQALNYLFGRNTKNDDEKKNEKNLEDFKVEKRVHSRNALTMLGRNVIWKTGAWERSGYWEWVFKFSPNVVLLQAGDCAFMFELAVKTAKKNGAKLVIYNSEGYYFKKFDYFRGKGIAHVVYPVFRRQLCKSLELAYNVASKVIYISDELHEAYNTISEKKSEIIYTGSSIQYKKKQNTNNVFTTVYCGNLGLNRHLSLIDVANELQRIDEKLILDVYGKAPNDEVAMALRNCKGIDFHGMVSYEKVKDLLRESDLLLHVESFDEFNKEDGKFGFSTKIADCLASGNCFLLYSPDNFSCYKYIKKNQVAYVAATKNELSAILRELILNQSAREKYQSAAIRFAEKNHSTIRTCAKFQNILYNV